MKKRKMIYLLMAGTLMTACSADNPGQEQTGRVPISLGYTTVTIDQTRAANDVNGGTSLTEGSVKVNVKKHSDSWDATKAKTYTAGAGGVLSATDQWYYYDDGSAVDIIAYYPAGAGTSFTVATDQSIDGDPDAASEAGRGYKGSDLMWATPIVNQARTPATLTLQLNHKMAKISVKPILGTGVTAITKIALKSILPTVTFDQTTGTVSAASGTATEIVVAGSDENTTNLADGTATYAAVIPEQTLAAGAFLEIIADGHAATYSLATSKTFYAGHQYTLNITVDASDFNAENSIDPWDETEAAINGDANLVNPLDIEDISAQTYTGSAITPTPTVTFNGNTITEGYSIYYFNNVYPGKALLTISYNGMYAAKEFVINPLPLSTVTSTSTEYIGWVIGSDGKVYKNAKGAASLDKTAVAIIAYVGSETGESSPYNHGLAISMKNANGGEECEWRATGDGTSNTSQYTTLNAALAAKESGYTLSSGRQSNTWPAFKAAILNDTETAGTAGVSVPSGTRGWFLPSVFQWSQIVRGFTNQNAAIPFGADADRYPAYAIYAYEGIITDAGGITLRYNWYWASSEYNSSQVWGYFCPGGWAGKTAKNNNKYVRSVLAF